MDDRYLRTSEVKEKYNITRLTLYKWEQEGLIDPARTPGGHRRYSQAELEDLLGIESHTRQGGCVYGRVSTRKQKDNLARQVRRLNEYAKRHDLPITTEVTDIASGLKENRRGLMRVLHMAGQGSIDFVLIEYKDRLARFGYHYLERFLESHGVEVLVKEDDVDKSAEEELVEDVLKIVTVFSARLYGKRGGRRVREAVEGAIQDANDD